VYHFSLFAFRRRFKFSAKSVLRCAATLRIWRFSQVLTLNESRKVHF
jgi:hypothetical protein